MIGFCVLTTGQSQIVQPELRLQPTLAMFTF